MSTELYKRFRPKKLATVAGQAGAVNALAKMMEKGKVPQCILLTGPSGCGKTTIARILKTHLECGDFDFVEINAADFKGIDTVRDIRMKVNLAPIDGKVKMWLVDEAHKLTNDAQNAFLKLLEDTPKHVHFILATTDPQKLLKTIMTRASELKLTLLSRDALMQVVNRVVGIEKLSISEDVLEEIVEAAEGSARKALVLLGQVADIEGEAEQLAALAVSVQVKDQAIEIARGLLNCAPWGTIASILKEVKDEPENIRWLVLGYAKSVLLGGGKLAPRAFIMISAFENNFYDSKHAGLVAACYQVTVAK